MQQLPDALTPLKNYKQFILWKLTIRDGKQIKLPIDHRTLQSFSKNSNWQDDPTAWTDIRTAINLVALCGPGFGVGFFFTVNDPFFFLDIDKCLDADNVTWSPVARSLCERLPGAAVEVSQSGRGLHIFGIGTCPEHGCRNKQYGLELYTERRFVALTGNNATGNAGVDCSASLPGIVSDYFPATTGGDTGVQHWTNQPVPEWNGPTEDNELIEKALASTSAASKFGGRASFADLWQCNEPVLCDAYAPDDSDDGTYNQSSADMALAQHLAFWTGKNCERIFILMWRSGLVREKWTSHDSYLTRTITRVCGLQNDVYGGNKEIAIVDEIGDRFGAAKLKGSDAQQQWANGIRAQKLIECMGEESLILTLCGPRGAVTSASFWIDNTASTPEEIYAQLTTIDQAGNPIGKIDGPELLTGYQFLGASQQVELFNSCVYIQSLHRIFTPDGSFLKSEQFNATYGGYVFQLDADGTGKTTRKAWEAFTESQAVRYAKAHDMCFRPMIPTGTLLNEDGRTVVNTYVEINTPRLTGDVTPFLNHLSTLIPDERDRTILLSYMAACIQHKGVKFQWAPIIQGIEGNGKTLFTRCVAFAIGRRYVHMPKAADIDNKFNAWLVGNLLIGVEDIYVPDHKLEIIEALKPMITGGDGIEIQGKGDNQITADICCNFIFNSNHKDAVRKTRTDRRFCVFYTAQQVDGDIERDGIQGEYFPNLYAWLKGDGYAIVAEYLERYAIPDELNPATSCHRAPVTTSTHEAITSSMGSIEQEIVEAIDEGRPGFAGGWVSSMAVDKLLENMRVSRIIPPNKRRTVLQSLGYDWHPGLKNGRVNNMIMLDGGKPRLFILDGHIHKNLEGPAEIARQYQEAQTHVITPAARAFNNDSKHTH